MIYVFYTILLFIAFLLLAPTRLVLSIARPSSSTPFRIYASWTYIAKTLGIAFYWQRGSTSRTSLLLGGRQWRHKRRPARPRPNGQQTPPPDHGAGDLKKPTTESQAEPAKPTAEPRAETSAKTAAEPKSKGFAARQYAGRRLEKWAWRELLDLAQGPGLTFLKRLYRNLQLKDLRAKGYFGLENPAHTGQVFSAILLFEELGYNKINLALKPDFDRVGLGGSLRLRMRLHLGHLLFSLLCFIVHLAAWRLWSRLQRRTTAAKTAS